MVKLPHFDLAPLQKFNPRVFMSEDPKEQEVCNFVLGLALIYNDFKDLGWAYNILDETKPYEPQVRGYDGQHAGFRLHILRLHCALMHELLLTIKQNRTQVEHPLFIKLLQLINEEVPKIKDMDVNKYWEDICNNFVGRNSSYSILREVLEKIRNKLTYHYHDNLDWFGKGYQYSFFEYDKYKGSNGYVSLGKNLIETRLYFADTVTEGYLNQFYQGKAKEFKLQLNKITWEVNVTFPYIVEYFIRVRGFELKEMCEAN